MPAILLLKLEQAGGALPRWHLFHHLHLLERAIIRLAPPSPTSGILSHAHSGSTAAAAPNGMATANPSAAGHESSQQQPDGSAANGHGAAANGAQALQGHLAWAAPAMLRLLLCLHSLWLPQVQQSAVSYLCKHWEPCCIWPPVYPGSELLMPSIAPASLILVRPQLGIFVQDFSCGSLFLAGEVVYVVSLYFVNSRLNGSQPV